MTESIQPAPLQEPVSVDDNSSSLTVDNAGLTELAGAIDTEVQVDVVTSALPTGAATAAKQDTAAGLLTTIDGDTGTIAGAVSGTEMQVDVLTIAAGNNNIGDVDVASIAAGDNNIGNVDIASIAAGDNNIGNVDVVTMPTTTVQATNLDIRDLTSASDSVVAAQGTAANLQVAPQPVTSGGLSTFHSNDLDETEEEVKDTAGQVYGWIITNRTTSPVYIHFYAADADDVTVGTTAPLFNFAVPGNSSDYVAAHLLGGMGIEFANAICVAATTDFPDDGNPAGPAANGVVCTVFYK